MLLDDKDRKGGGLKDASIAKGNSQIEGMIDNQIQSIQKKHQENFLFGEQALSYIKDLARSIDLIGE